MATTVSDLKAFVGITHGNDDVAIQGCHAQALALVTKMNRVWDSESEAFVTSAAPVDIVDRSVLAVGAELYWQTKAKNGIAQFATLDDAPVRIARDPKLAAIPLLSPWVVFM